MKPRPHDYGEGWDSSDESALLRFRRQGKTYAWIAAHMGRSLGAVRSKLYRLKKEHQ